MIRIIGKPRKSKFISIDSQDKFGFTDLIRILKVMNKTSTSLFVFSIYLLGTGLGLVFIPNTILDLLKLPHTNEIWIHVLGVVILVLSFYFMQAARQNVRSFAGWTVFARIGVFLCFTGFVILGWVGPVLILLGAVDLLGALWTGWTLRT